MLCKCHWIVLYTVHFTAFCLGGGAFFSRTRCMHSVVSPWPFNYFPENQLTKFIIVDPPCNVLYMRRLSFDVI